MVIERPKRLNVRITHEEWSMLEALADREGMSASDYVRQFIRRAHATAFGDRPQKPRKK
jgi:uncharacterized protein (DUF1778 family)